MRRGIIFGIIFGIICTVCYGLAACGALHAGTISSLPDGSSQVSQSSVVPVDVTLGGATKRITIAQLLSIGASAGLYNGIFSVHFTGDLTGTATALKSQYIDWNQTTGPTSIANRPNLGAVATSNNYNDLSNLPNLNSTGTGRLIKTTYYTYGSGTFTTQSSTSTLELTLCGGGGAGGGCAGTTTTLCAAAGGSAAPTLEAIVTVSPSTGYSYSVGLRGVPASGANPGGNGGATSITIGGATYSAVGGTGGNYMAVGSAVNVVLGGGSQTTCTNADVCHQGPAGGPGIRLSANVGVSGTGGNSFIGAGGQGPFINGGDAAGYPAFYCAGGGGAFTSASGSAMPGGFGGYGYLRVREYSE